MPATNRGMAQLRPAVDTVSNSRNYLRSQLPSWSTLQSGLAVFAVIVILRSCVRRLYSWFARPSDQPSQPPSECFPRHKPVQEQEQAQQTQYVSFDHIGWEMDEKRRSRDIVARTRGHVNFEDSDSAAQQRLTGEQKWKNTLDSVQRPLMSRPPPAPPLTPPELSTSVFTFEEKPRSQDSFIHQPNPDYTSATSTTSMSPSGSTSPIVPRRRSYNKTLPIGIPMPVGLSSEVADLTTSPNSYPPTSPLLPPPPPGDLGFEDEGRHRSIGVQGEIISMLDGDGAGWTRHTRVYGGGVCLACAAAGGEHGGFYGATVSPEEMR